MNTDKYYLKNYKILIPLDFEFQEFIIHIKPLIPNSYSAGILTISKNDIKSTDAAPGKPEKIAVGCIELIGFALSRNVIFNKSYQGIRTNNRVRLKPMVDGKSGGYPILREKYIVEFLDATLEKYLQLDKRTWKIFFTCFDYLCQAKSGYAEDRIFRIAQCWEILASHFVKEKIELPTELIDLKKSIRFEYKKWKKELTNSQQLDPTGSIGNAISNLFNNVKFHSKMVKLCQLADFDPNSIQLDLRELKRLRDSTAHTGAIDINGQTALQTLMPANYGIQKIIFKLLGYKGKGLEAYQKFIPLFKQSTE